MIDTSNKEIDVDEIMRKIREEVKRRKELPEQETFQETEQLISKSPTTEDNTIIKSFDHLLWKYGRRYKKIIKTVPILKYFAKKQHSRLAYKFIQSQPVTKQSLPSPLDINVLPYYINYHGFLVQIKKDEGLKGRIKSFLFKFIRFFAWWQEQINRALYQELMSQKAKMEELSKRDKMIEDLNNRLILIGQATDELSRELGDQRVKIGEAESHLEGLLNQQRDHLMCELAERDTVVESLNNRLVQFGRVEEELHQGLVIQKEKLDEIEKVAQNSLNQRIDNLRVEFTGVHKVLDAAVESVRKELSGLLEVKSDVSYMTKEMRDHKLNILDQQRRLMFLLEEARKRLPGPIGPKQIKNMLKEEDHLLDGMYVNLEYRFRGTREDIKERLKVYLPYVEQAKKGKRDFFILDLGCGRGEWLELLREHGYIARGVDLNGVQVRQCQEIGLDVIEADVIEYLRNQQLNSLGAVTGFHILEHLSFKAIISLFDETLRILKSGGVAIFETPNPENLLVGTCNFYLDPTHRHLLPPQLLKFLLESRGFERTEIKRLHPYEFLVEAQNTSTAIKSLISLFNKEQDYAVIAYKE